MVARQMTMLRYCAPLWAIMGLLAGCQQPGGGEGMGFKEASVPWRVGCSLAATTMRRRSWAVP